MELFDKRDILTGITADQAVKGDKGYFGGCLRTIAYNVEQDNVHRLCDINEDETSCFTDEEGLDYLFFLPANKVKEKVKKPTYRPLQSISELFAFMMPEYADKGYTTDDMIDLLLGQHYTLKDKTNDTIRHLVVSSLSIGTDGIIHLDFLDLKSLFDDFEFKKGAEFVPFGIGE